MPEEPDSPETGVRQDVSALRDALTAGRDQVIINHYAAGSDRGPARVPASTWVNRLLAGAVEAASSLTGGAKAAALIAIIPAADLVAPERVRELAAEAETAALSVADPRSRQAVLAATAEGLAAVNPGRAERLVRSIENERQRAAALAAVAGIMQAADPQRAGNLAAEAEALTGSPEELSSGGQAEETRPRMAEWARRARMFAMLGDLETAVASATMIQGQSGRDAALAVVALAAARRGDLQGAVVAARSLEDETQRARALAVVAEVGARRGDLKKGVAIARSLEETFGQALALAGVSRGISAVNAELAKMRTAETMDIVRSIGDASRRSEVLAILAEAVAAFDCRQAEDIALSLEDASQKVRLLVSLVHRFAGEVTLWRKGTLDAQQGDLPKCRPRIRCRP